MYRAEGIGEPPHVVKGLSHARSESGPLSAPMPVATRRTYVRNPTKVSGRPHKRTRQGEPGSDPYWRCWAVHGLSSGFATAEL